MATASPGKVCVVCGTNCAKTPRVKDRRGRYYCKPCYEEALRRAKGHEASAEANEHHTEREPRNPSANWGGSLLNESESSKPALDRAAQTCPECDAALEPGAVLCVNCGYVLRAGKHITPEIVEGDDESEAAEEGEAPRRTAWPIVMGVVSLIFAAFGAVSYGAGALSIALTPPAELGGPMFWAAWLVLMPIQFALSVGLGVLAIGLFMRRAIAPIWLERWAWVKIAASVVLVALIAAQFTVETPPDFAFIGAAVMALVVPVSLLWLLFWPVFVLLWLRRKTIREEVSRWP